MEKTQVLEAVVGLQWGDEGKGKIVDERVAYAKSLDDGKRTVVVRFQGGSNAGHTILARGPLGELNQIVTHSASCGLASNSDIAIGPSVAFNPLAFVGELDSAVQNLGYKGRVLISNRVGVLLDYHILLDSHAEENRLSSVGSTKQGIGPFYECNAGRTPRLTFKDYLSQRFPTKLREVLSLKRGELESAGLWRDDLHEEIVEKNESARNRLRSFGEDLEDRLYEYFQRGNHIIIEGAQGTGLDVDMGDIPYTTSSHLLAPHAFPSLGLPRKAFRILGVEKIYPTRVGLGGLPSLTDDSFADIGKNAGEVGATTGRMRRVGYPDWAFIKRAARLNECDGIILTRADNVQDVKIKVCMGYNDKESSLVNGVPCSLTGMKAIYGQERYKWHLWDGPKDLSNPLAVDEILRSVRADYVRNGLKGLPSRLRDFVEDHDNFVECETVGISIGPSRGETIYF
ncbi:adenylosuccinate synthetase [Candidatus Pacearchaeota archaeon]|nr:adenylosuccinate synthetase [Candidatus Pacearchaeota archaeon]